MIKVFLREKKLLHGKRGLYLDFYPPITHPETLKETRREHLRLNIFEKPKTDLEKEHNKETKMLAENIRAQRQLEFQAGVYGFVTVRNKQKDFIAYFRHLSESKLQGSKSNYENWLSVLKHLESFAGGNYKFGDLSERFCLDFKDFLLNQTTLSNNSASSYFDKFKIAVRDAYRNKMLSENPAESIKSIKLQDTQREFLTLEEMQRLARTPFEYEDLRRASLFSILTGLRYSDIAKLTWKEIQQSDTSGFFIRFTQKKTKGSETLPISEDACSLLGERGLPDEKAFKDLDYWQCAYLPVWTKNAGIDKKITFHCFRHTYATLQLTLGTDIYTVSKMLGHKNLQTTQLYAKVIDERKREAANKIKLR
jgi:integrase